MLCLSERLFDHHSGFGGDMNTVGIISTVKAPTSQLYLFVNYHFNIGIDYIILFFDDPEDESIDLFSYNNNICIIRCSAEYWRERAGGRPKSIEERQIVNVNQGAKYLLLKKYNWLIHIDSDELLNPLQPLKKILINCNADALRFSVLEAVSERNKYDHIFLPTLFKKKASDVQILLAKKLGCSNAIFDGEYFRSHTASKMAIKISNNINKYGIHEPLTDNMIVIEDTKKIQLLHYDCVDIDTWKLKWDRRLDGSGKAIDMRDNRKSQLLLYKKAKREGELQLSILFMKMHGIRRRERWLLYLLGMLKPVKLNYRLFEHQDMKINE